MNHRRNTDRLAEIGTAVVIVLYLLFALFRLGSPYVPSTGWESNEKGREILLDFGEERDFAGFVYYLGNYENRTFLLQAGSGDPIRWQDAQTAEMQKVYQWGAVLLETRGRYVRLITEKIFTDVRELIFFDQDGKEIRPVNTEDYPELFDEAAMYPGYQSFQDGTVFDEPVFARTAYEYLHGIRSYEDTHPPLGKLLIAVGIALFGMNPFGWRFMGAVAGAGMLAALWVLSRRLYKNPWISLFTVMLLAADFLHFTHTRLAQVDAFLVLFIMGMYYFMLRYMEELGYSKTAEYTDDPENKNADVGNRTSGNAVRFGHIRIWLALSGICMGCAISCKWSGCYAAVGLAMLWAISTAWAWRERIVDGNGVARICAWCVLVFILVPVGIYLASYIPYVAMDRTAGFAERVFRNQVNMFRYHRGVKPDHLYASKWYQWPLIIKPVVYYQIIRENLQESVILMGNPVLWWGGIAAFFYSVYEVLENGDRKGLFLLTAFLSPLLPWMMVSRSSFLYHYFPCIPVLALMLGFAAEKLGRKGTAVMGICAAGAAVLFFVYYPVLSGYPVPQGYLTRLTGWLPWWSWLS